MSFTDLLGVLLIPTGDFLFTYMTKVTSFLKCGLVLYLFIENSLTLLTWFYCMGSFLLTSYSAPVKET